jgi:hypothetical protein
VCGRIVFQERQARQFDPFVKKQNDMPRCSRRRQTAGDGVWIALDSIYFAGRHTALNGVKEQRNTRAGFTLALPIDSQNSLNFMPAPASQPVQAATLAQSKSRSSIAGAMAESRQRLRASRLASRIPAYEARGVAASVPNCAGRLSA